MTKTDILLTITIQCLASDENKEKISIWGLLVDMIPNSPDLHHKNRKADTKNY